MRPMKGGRNPLRNALVSVEMAGENSAAWAKATRSAGVLDGLLITGAARCGVVGSSKSDDVSTAEVGRTHSPSGFLGQVTTVPSGAVIVHWCLVNMTWHPWLHSGARASNELPSSGKMCACRAARGMPRMGISPVCDEWMHCWLATLTGRGTVVAWMLRSGVASAK